MNYYYYYCLLTYSFRFICRKTYCNWLHNQRNRKKIRVKDISHWPFCGKDGRSFRPYVYTYIRSSTREIKNNGQSGLAGWLGTKLGCKSHLAGDNNAHNGSFTITLFRWCWLSLRWYICVLMQNNFCIAIVGDFIASYTLNNNICYFNLTYSYPTSSSKVLESTTC